MSDEVSIIRLSRAMPGVWVESQIGPHIALPAAKHSALMRVVEAARAERLARLVYRDVRLVEPVGSDALKSLVWAENELIAAVDAYLATAPERQGGD